MTRPTLNGRKIQLLYAGAEDNAAKELTEKVHHPSLTSCNSF